MPIPKPSKNEAKKDFLSRCMNDPVMIGEYGEADQRYAVCYGAWNDRLMKDKIIEKIKSIKYLLFKADYYDRIEQKLADMMVNTWDKNAKGWTADVIRKLVGTGDYKGLNPDDILTQLEKDWIKDLSKDMNEFIPANIHDVYLNSTKEVIGTGFSFNLKDKKAMEWLSGYNKYWIGNYYDKYVHEAIRDEVRYVIDEGLNTAAAGKYLENKLGAIYDKPPKFRGSTRSYYELLSNHVVRRSREFARTTAYSKSGIEYLRIVAVVDHRTTEICKEMNGRIIPVKWAENLMNDLISADSPEDVKNISPWMNDEDVEREVKDKKTKDIPKHLAFPPYHARCRTRTVRSSLSEWEQQDIEENARINRPKVKTPPAPKPVPAKPKPSKPKPAPAAARAPVRGYNAKASRNPFVPLPDKWVAHKTKGEAEDYFLKYFAEKYVDLSSFSLDIINDLSKELYDVWKLMEWGKVDYIGSWQGYSKFVGRRARWKKISPAAFARDELGDRYTGILFDQKILASYKKSKYAGYIRSNEMMGSNYTRVKIDKFNQAWDSGAIDKTNPWNIAAHDVLNDPEWKYLYMNSISTEASVWHEAGHLLAYYNDEYSKFSREIWGQHHLWSEILCDYSASKIAETESESFYCFIGNDRTDFMRKKIHPYLLEILQKVTGKD